VTLPSDVLPSARPAGLRAIEETVASLCRLPAVIKDAEATETAAQLAGRVGRLRDALEGLHGGTG